jgi:hypothetical protein
MKKKFLAVLILAALALPSYGQYVAQDPTRYVPSGRVLGLGKAYIALSDDVGAIFTNPSGMADAEGWQLSSMQGQLLDEFNYLSFAGIYATPAGVFGLGFAGSSISGAYSGTIEAGSDPEDPIYVIDLSEPVMGNYNNAFVLSYANHMEKINYLNRLPLAKDLSVGANLKLFQVSIYGDGITGGDANGMELDLGAKYSPPIKWMNFGIAVQNMLPFNMGGKLSYDSGHEESYPAVVEVGSAFRVLGKENSFRALGGHELTLLADFDHHPTLNNYPVVWHLGAEWKPIPIFAIRMGIDQDTAGDGLGGLEVISDQTWGIGLQMAGLHFDYAYHAFTGAPDTTNHFFSLSYKFKPRVKVVGEDIVVQEPRDKHITFQSTVVVVGKVNEPSVRKLTVNNVPVRFSLTGDFTATADLKIGKNAILIKGWNASGKKVAEVKLRALRLKPFPDVPEDHWVRKPISLLAMQTIITGYPDGTFKPEGNITRAEMCTLLMKTRKLGDKLASPEAEGKDKDEDKAAFADVSVNHWAAPYVARAAELGVVKGYPDGTFRPKNNITRAEGLAMVARFAGISKEAFTAQFPDVAARHWAAEIIAGAYRAGILEYLDGKNFELKKLLTRAETVEMLQRTRYVREDVIAKDLLNWATY